MISMHQYIAINESIGLNGEENAKVLLQLRKDGYAGSTLIVPDTDKHTQVTVAIAMLNEYILHMAQTIDVHPAQLALCFFVDEEHPIERLIDDATLSTYPTPKKESKHKEEKK